MSHIWGRKHQPGRDATGSVLLTALLMGLPGLATAEAAEPAPKKLATVKVEAQTPAERAPYKAEKSGSVKQPQRLLDTPQTVSVVSKALIQEQGATSLAEALRVTPGITLMLGENGYTATGDAVSMRGFDSQSSLFLDGVRDLGGHSRDVFNTEQIDVSKGPSGSDYGRGPASGSINMVSKQASLTPLRSLQASVGSADFQRVSADLNQPLSAHAALRVNAVWQEGGVAGRDQVAQNRKGLAPALSFGLDTATRVHLYGQFLQHDNTPDGGVPTVGLKGYVPLETLPNNGGVKVLSIAPKPVRRENWYGGAADRDDVDTEMLTLRIEHDFSETTRVQNITRKASAEQFYLVTGVHNANFSKPDPKDWTVNLLRQHRDQDNDILTNQTHLQTRFETGAIIHNLSVGLEGLRESQTNRTFAPVTLPAANLYRPDRHVAALAQAPTPNGTFSDGQTETLALYVFDTLYWGEHWLLTVGTRFESYRTDFQRAVISTATSHPGVPAGRLVQEAFRNEDDLFTWKIGPVYKPDEDSSYYLNLSTSAQPPGGANFALSAGTQNLKPQDGRNLEMGGKWDVLDHRLLLTAALFRSENENDLSTQDPVTKATVQYGRKRVQGAELSASGAISAQWHLSAGYARMDTEIAEGTATQTGAALTFTPKNSFTLWTTWLPFEGLSIGGGVRYQDGYVRTARNANATTPASMVAVPDSWLMDGVLRYTLTPQASVSFNVYNLLDNEAIGAINNSGARYTPVTPRSGRLSLAFTF